MTRAHPTSLALFPALLSIACPSSNPSAHSDAPSSSEAKDAEPLQPIAVRRPALPGDFKHGWSLFREHCVNCHGAGRRGTGIARAKLPTPPADLRDPILLASRTNDELANTILYGRNLQPAAKPARKKSKDDEKEMPAFSSEMGEQDVLDIIAFLRGDSIYLEECFADGTHYLPVQTAEPGPPLFAVHAAAARARPVVVASGSAITNTAPRIGYVAFFEIDLPGSGPTPVAILADLNGTLRGVRVALQEPLNRRAQKDIESALSVGLEAAPNLRNVIVALKDSLDWMSKAIRSQG